MKVLFYINSPSNYQFDFFEELKKKHDIFVIYQNKYSDNFKPKIKKKDWVLFLNNNKNLLVDKILKKFNPKLVIIGGYKLDIKSRYIIKDKIKKFYWLERVNEDNKIKNIIRYLYLKNKLKKIDGIFAIGRYATNFYKKFNSNVYNVPYSINLEKKTKNYKTPNFLFVGQMINRKGIHSLLDSITKTNANECTFTFVGTGSLVKNIKKIMKLKKNVFYYNFKNKNKLNKIYNKCNILILPSIYDGWGVVIIEAMSRAMAVISNNNVGAANEYIKHNINGRIFDIDNNLENQINFYINNIKKIKLHGERNRIIFEKNLCNSENLVKKVNLVFNKLNKD
jgi:glycosyltransferase involved in cell wall biosynthesis